MITDHVTIQPYGIDFYIMSTDSKEEDKVAEKVFNKAAKSIGISKVFTAEDTRDWISAFDHGYKKGKLTAVIFIHNKKLNELDLLHELIHFNNWINSYFNISTKPQEDEAVAVFFEYLVKETLELLNRNCIKVTRLKLPKRIPICKPQLTSTPS